MSFIPQPTIAGTYRVKVYSSGTNLYWKYISDRSRWITLTTLEENNDQFKWKFIPVSGSPNVFTIHPASDASVGFFYPSDTQGKYWGYGYAEGRVGPSDNWKCRKSPNGRYSNIKIDGLDSVLDCRDSSTNCVHFYEDQDSENQRFVFQLVENTSGTGPTAGQGQTFVVTGASGGAPNRLEINDFIKDEKFFSLYIQALQAMQTKPQSDLLSFFQISGIHGLPYTVWNGATGDRPFDPNASWGGYCTHGSVLFPTWHRPYIMLFEQILQQRAVDIAATYTVDTENWKQAALNLRQPFWDWARNYTPPDEVIALKQVTITGYDGRRVRVDNPLYQYRFHPIDSSFLDPFSRWPTTLRQPTNLGPNATDNVARLRRILANGQNNVTTNTYNMLTRVKTWPAFSNHTVGDGGSTSNSVESIHDGIHFDIAGNGQMTDPAVAAFDPIFYLHHANVDRLLSLWSCLHPGVWVSPADSIDGNFTIRAGVPVDRNTALAPFWNSQTTFWDSTAVSDTTKLGYTYPEFNGLDMGNTNAVMAAIGNIVNQLYGSSTFGASSARTIVPETRKLQQQALFVQNPVQQNPGNPNVHGQSSASPNQDVWDWTARIEFKKYELGSSFSVLIFLGEVPEDPEEWRVCSNYVGSLNAFVNSAAGQCINCSDQADVVQEGFVHLNHAIVKHSGLGSLEPDVIEPYLTDALQWRIQKPDGSVVNLESLEVTVYATPMTYPPGTTFPVPGQARRHHRITHGQTGGCRHAS